MDFDKVINVATIIASVVGVVTAVAVVAEMIQSTDEKSPERPSNNKKDAAQRNIPRPT